MKPMLALGTQQDLVRDGAGQSAHGPAVKVSQRAEPRRVGVADAQHLAEFVIRDGDGQGGAPGGRVLDPAEPDVRVVTLDRLVERCERDRDELGCGPDRAPGGRRSTSRRPPRRAPGRLNEGAPPSGSPLLSPGRLGGEPPQSPRWRKQPGGSRRHRLMLPAKTISVGPRAESLGLLSRNDPFSAV